MIKGNLMDNISKGLDLQDLVLLMDAYKNNIELTTTLMEQVKQILSQQCEIINSQKELCKEMANTTNAMKDFSISIVEKITDTNKDISEVKLEVIKGNSSLQNVIYVALVGTAGLITSIITLTINLSNKYDLIEKIAVSLGIPIK